MAANSRKFIIDDLLGNFCLLQIITLERGRVGFATVAIVDSCHFLNADEISLVVKQHFAESDDMFALVVDELLAILLRLEVLLKIVLRMKIERRNI